MSAKVLVGLVGLVWSMGVAWAAGCKVRAGLLLSKFRT